MRTRRSASRLALWAFAAALLLKAAVPMLASISAQMQGRDVVEICTAYGVVAVALDAGAPAPAQGAGHGSDACVLTALLALAATPVGTIAAPAAPQGVAGAAPVGRRAVVVDAAAMWVALLGHGPPASS